MADFVEQATLVVNDRSVSQIKKINAALKELFRTATKLKNLKININVQGLEKANRGLQRFNRNLAITQRRQRALMGGGGGFFGGGGGRGGVFGGGGRGGMFGNRPPTWWTRGP